MISVSKRLAAIASLVPLNSRVIDVGCDHALLDIYLEKEKDIKCIASDINENVIKIAKKNKEKYHSNITIIQSDGLDKINIENQSTCIIAGMGTNTIIKILNNQKINNINNFIIQTNNDYKLLRETMMKKNYHIVDEIVFLDKNIWYIIIKFKKGFHKYSNIELELGPILIKKKDKVYFTYLLNSYSKILNSIPKKYILKRLHIKYLISYIKKLGPSS